MSKIDPGKYSYEVCPHCKSKKLSPVAVVRLEKNEYFKDMSQVQRTGRICNNCQRYIARLNIKSIYDYAEIRRDIKALQKFLDKHTQRKGD